MPRLSDVLLRLHDLIRRCYPPRARARDDRRLGALVDRLLAEADGEAERRGVAVRALADATVTLPRAWLDALRGVTVARASAAGVGMELRLAWRRLLEAPGFTVVGVLTLALAIGAVSAIFTAVDAFFLRDLPYESAERVVVLSETAEGSVERGTVSAPNYLDWRRELESLDDVAAFNGTGVVLTGAGEASVVPASVVTTNFFDVLGVRPALGDGLREAHAARGDSAEPARVAVLSHPLWVRHFGSDPRVVDRRIELNERAYRVVGVMPEGFRAPRTFLGTTPAQLWTPLDLSANTYRRDAQYLHVFGRLRDDVGIDAARAELDAVWAGMVERFPDALDGSRAMMEPIDQVLFGDQRPLLVVLLGAAGLLLLLACVNMANLQLARALRREKDLAVQAALGSGRSGISRQLLLESGLVALLGGGAGVALLFTLGRSLAAVVSPVLNPLARIEMDWRVVAFTVAVTAGVGLLFGLLPALRLARTDVAGTLRSQRAASTGGRARSLLVVAEVALTLVLVFGAGLLGRSFLRLTSVEPGFAVERSVLFQVRLPSDRYGDADAVLAFYDRLEERLEAEAGVEGAAFVSDLPLTSANRSATYTVPDSDDPDREFGIEYHTVSDDYFQTAGITLLDGRGFRRGDGAEGRAVVVNRALARRVFGEGPVVGRTLSSRSGEVRIVGLVESTVDDGLDEAPQPRLYRPLRRRPGRFMWVVVRTAGPTGPLEGRVRDLVAEVDPGVAVADPTTMAAHVASSVSRPRGAAALTGAFGGLGLLMAALGIYGVLASAVAERTSELGVRAALGADRSKLVGLVLRRTAGLAGVGMAVGFVAAPVAGSLLRSQLYAVPGWDPAALVLSVVVVALTALAASWIPARRAARADPLVAMRAE